ncbi:hypothetical protein 2 [Hubei picorna-like virus 67]|uniref:hypothetical protein 2 n=1 Tax=Hubei picorna-like virus 67 TaxID=1923150 RepID=UPI00090B8B54|nr:hypothetical protein 2 [Hubei picorna-like virus 67]APG78379.1 hypothetical protein 2 [Hubei picorna-like virus 67]
MALFAAEEILTTGLRPHKIINNVVRPKERPPPPPNGRKSGSVLGSAGFSTSWADRAQFETDFVTDVQRRSNTSTILRSREKGTSSATSSIRSVSGMGSYASSRSLPSRFQPDFKSGFDGARSVSRNSRNSSRMGDSNVSLQENSGVAEAINSSIVTHGIADSSEHVSADLPSPGQAIATGDTGVESIAEEPEHLITFISSYTHENVPGSESSSESGDRQSRASTPVSRARTLLSNISGRIGGNRVLPSGENARSAGSRTGASKSKEGSRRGPSVLSEFAAGAGFSVGPLVSGIGESINAAKDRKQRQHNLNMARTSAQQMGYPNLLATRIPHAPTWAGTSFR